MPASYPSRNEGCHGHEPSFDASDRVSCSGSVGGYNDHTTGVCFTEGFGRSNGLRERLGIALLAREKYPRPVNFDRAPSDFSIKTVIIRIVSADAKRGSEDRTSHSRLNSSDSNWMSARR